MVHYLATGPAGGVGTPVVLGLGDVGRFIAVFNKHGHMAFAPTGPNGDQAGTDAAPVPPDPLAGLAYPGRPLPDDAGEMGPLA
ncbi:hypothetical protein K2X14_08510 [Acetobacter sp. TBRC 12305]|uniref:Uncharacterized protein n=1 Tax=Acetobacter garciniae TaxID=2817435 RepID=A0A939HNU7_9PROT|nr:hypothetical protein [Acetobacter garciniae]MBO1325158.1 hypothetical protein [Acetobacter garciniae]MBX0344871.1 hypothetical protein [Acetobacter garciniae]